MTAENNKERSLLEQQRHQLAVWLSEWQMDQWLTPSAADDACDPRTQGQRTVHPLASYLKPDLKDGDIRLMAPVEGAQSPLYALVLSAREGRGVDWIPFSRFAHAALPGEWQTGMRFTPLGVLCVWNRRVSSLDTAPPSWRVKRLTKTQSEEWRRVVAAILQRQDLDESVSRRTGPPLLHPADPRHRYLAEERERWGACWERGGASVTISFDNGESGPYLAEVEQDSSGMLLAAETAGYYGVSKGQYKARTPDGVVIVECEQTRGDRASLRVVGASGECLHQFDGGYVETADGVKSEPIQAARAAIRLAAGSRLLALIDSEGKRFALEHVRRK